MDYSIFIVDAVLVLIFVLVILNSARVGFSRSFAGIVAWVAATVIALNYCAPVSEQLYLHLFQDRVIEIIEKNIQKQGSAVESITVTQDVLQELPDVALKAVESMGVDVDALTMGTKTVNATGSNVAQTVERDVIGPIIKTALKSAMFLLILITIVLVGRWLLSFVGKGIEKIPGIGQVDRALGAVLGILKAAVIVGVLAIMLCMAKKFIPAEYAEMIEKSKLVAFIQNSPFADGFFIKNETGV